MKHRQTPNGLNMNDRVVGWSRCPYGFRIPESPDLFFKNLLEQEKFAVEADLVSEDDKQRVNEWYRTLELANPNSVPMTDLKSGDELPVHPTQSDKGGNLALYTMPNYSDTRVGGNDAINPYWQFNRDDDIVPRMLMIPGVVNGDTEYGMGRVYSERYDSNQQILWLCMGVAEFTDLVSFYFDAGDSDAAKTMTTGSLAGLGAKIVTTAIKGTIWAFTFPIVAPFWMFQWIKRADSTRITKYYWFSPSMTLYYEMVNTMLSYLAVGMGLYPTLLKKRMDSAKVLSVDTQSDNLDVYNPVYDAWGDVSKGVKFSAKETGIPELLKDGPDIFVIMNRRVKLFNAHRANVTTRQLLAATRDLDQAKQLFSRYGDKYDYVPNEEGDKSKGRWVPRSTKDENAILNLYSTIKGTMFGGHNFVGFRIEKSNNASESVSNETGQTSIAQKLNSIAQQYREEYEDTMGGNVFMKLMKNINASDVTDGIMKTMKTEALRHVAGLADVAGFGDVGTIITNGNGYFDIPDVWKGSSFSKNYSFTIDLNARYGDPVSIYQSIYIPMIMSLGTALPRSIGTSMYTSPFLVKAFCKGHFAIPCGIVTSWDATRGSTQHGWSMDRLPTQVSINFSIKDMTPAMFMGMEDIGFFDTMSRNETMHEYLDTLSALGVSERLFLFPQAIRKATAALLVTRNTIFSSTYWGVRMGNTGLAKATAYLAPFGNHEKSDITYNVNVL